MNDESEKSKIIKTASGDSVSWPTPERKPGSLWEGEMLDSALETWGTDGSRFVEILAAGDLDRPLGLKIGGAFAGPDVLVAGHDPMTSLVYDRLLRLPTLHWMRGTLTLVYLNVFDEAAIPCHVASILDQQPDELLFLPYAANAQNRATAAKEGYWSVLRLCAKLGMISGRGIPPGTSLPE